MDGIWTLVVVLGVVGSAGPGSAQSSSRTLFVVSATEVHAGISTPLAVTVLANFSGSVTAEVSHGNDKVSETGKQDFQGGLTRIITLPPIFRSFPHNSLLNLTVKGYKEDGLIFSENTTIGFSLRNVSSFIQTDRLHYRPGDTVKVRVVSVQLDNLPYRGRVEISVEDPSGKVVNRWESTGNPGIVLREFSLSERPVLGMWIITVNGGNNKGFYVEDQELPPFGLLVKTPTRVLMGDHITGSVRALYPSGQPVQGTLTISVTLVSDSDDSPSKTQTKQIYGSTQFIFSRDVLQELYTSPGIGRHSRLLCVATVTDSFTGYKVEKVIMIYPVKDTFQLSFHDFPSTLKPSLHFSTNLSVSRYDRKPLSSEDLMYSVTIEVTQSSSGNENDPTILTLAVPKDGNVHIEFELQEDVETLFIRARFQSSVETLRVSNKYSSASGSYIQISRISPLPAQIGSPLELQVESTFPLTELHFVVSSRGQVVAAGTETSPSISLTPTLSWSPEACVTVYCVLPDGEVASDRVHIPINKDQVSLRWTMTRAQPGDHVSLTLTAPESQFSVGIAVMGSHDDDDAPQADPDLTEEKDCTIKMLTNGRLDKENQPHGHSNGGGALMVEKYWNYWMDGTESLLWLDADVSARTWTSEIITVVDGFTSLRAFAVVMSDSLGLGFTPVPPKLAVSKDFSMSLKVPSKLIMHEEIVLEVNIINHLDHDIEVIVLLAQSEAFRFVLADRGDVSVANAQKLNLESHASGSALFPIRPVTLGEMEICVDAVSSDATDRLVWKGDVKPRGVEKSVSKTLFLELREDKESTSVSFVFPPDVVPGSQRAHVAVFGDILALSMSHLDSLVELPLGCGEQNMIHFAPGLYVLLYLDLSGQNNEGIRSRALGYMRRGYQRQLPFQRDDGSFSAFGDRDISGSTWLTAFVLRCFLQTQPFMQVDQHVLTGAMTWLLTQQGAEGEFVEAGKPMHTEMQGGTAALTAYVLMALLEDESYADMYSRNVHRAQQYLEKAFSSGGLSNYSLSLVAYALTLANSPEAEAALNELSRRADKINGVMMWSSSAGLGSGSPDWPPRSAQLEITGYVLLAHFRRGTYVVVLPVMKWLSQQLNHLGGYGTTQDTIVALHALAHYAAFSGASAIDLKVDISAPTFSSQFLINSSTFQMVQTQEIDADKDIHLNIVMEGIGFALIQLNVFYNLESGVFSQDHHHSTEEAFSLDVHVIKDRDLDHMQISICTKLQSDQVISQTGMVIVDVGMLSGFSLPPGARTPSELIRKVEVLPEKVSLYLDSLSKAKVCITLPIVRDYRVAHVQDAVVHMYDYYEPTRHATRTYNHEDLYNLGSCFFCGYGCQRCWPGITLTVSSHSSSINSATYSFISLLLGVTAYFIVI